MGEIMAKAVTPPRCQKDDGKYTGRKRTEKGVRNLFRRNTASNRKKPLEKP